MDATTYWFLVESTLGIADPNVSGPEPMSLVGLMLGTAQ